MKQYLRSLSLLVCNTIATNFMPTVKMVFQKNGKPLNPEASPDFTSKPCFDSPEENKEKAFSHCYLRRQSCGGRRQGGQLTFPKRLVALHFLLGASHASTHFAPSKQECRL